MKRIVILLLLLPTLGVSQTIKTSKIDKFTKRQIIETSFEKISTNHFSGVLKNVWIAFQRNGETDAVWLKWNTGAIVGISEGAELIFLDKDGNTYEFINRHREVSSKGAGTIGFVGSADYGVNLYFDGDVSIFKEKEFTDFRIHTTDGYVDFIMLSQANKKIKGLYSVFEKEIIKVQP